MTTLSNSIVGGKNYPEQEKDKEELREKLLDVLYVWSGSELLTKRIDEILKDYTIRKVAP